MSNDQSSDDTQDNTPDDNSVDTPEPRGLRRSRDRRVIAGVAGGIAERFDVNENLVRVIFVALTLFWGLGAALYLVLWVALRSSPQDESLSTQRERTPESTSHRLTIAIVAALVVLAILAVVVARPVRILGPGLAGAWIIFLVALSIIAIRTRARRLTLRRVAGVIFLAAVSAVIVLVGVAMGFLASTGVPLTGGNGDHLWQPASMSQVAHVYRAEFGRGTLDLSGVSFPASGFTLAVSVAAGELRIVVPRNAVVDLTTNVGAGEVIESPAWNRGVPTLPYSSVPNGLATAKGAQSPHLSIDARIGAGVIDLMRATR